MSCSGRDLTPEDKKPIEETEAAAALADYFNNGGVGGISALDFGFSSTPSFYPDHLFEPRYKHLDEEQFYIRNEQCYMSCKRSLPPAHPPWRSASDAR
jgi:hypothetical protein